MGRLEQMEAFVRTAEARSFTLAARQLGLSKSVVSQRVAELEARLGVRLITRTTRRLSLTEAGEAFLARSARVVEEVDEAEETAAGQGGLVCGTIRIAAPLSFALLHLRPLVFEFMAAHPALGVELDLDDRVVDLVEGGYDLALRIGRLADSAMVARRLAPVRTLCCASPAYLAARGRPERPQDLTGHDCLLYRSSTLRGDLWRFRVTGEWVSVAVAGRLRANNGDLLLAAAVAGLGIALLPSFILRPEIDRGALVPLLEDHPPPDAGLYAVYPQRVHLPSRVRLFTDFLAERIGREPYWDRPAGAG